MKRALVVGFVFFAILAAIAAMLAVVFLPFLSGREAEADLAVAAPIPTAALPPRPQYLPPRVEAAPDAIRAQVMEGHDLMAATTLWGQPGGQRLTCSSCHFFGGRNEGGRNNGFSLVGVAAQYPQGSPTRDLETRMAACFRKNLHVTPPLPDDRRLVAMATYLRWISQGTPYYSSPAWLVPATLVSASADVGAGERTWRDLCSPCHGPQGEGSRIAPATWGPGSFTTASQILAPGLLERFVKDNMPRENPHLDERAATDVTAFLRRHPRPTSQEP